MKNRQSDKNLTKQIRIDGLWHKLLKVYAAESRRSIRDLVEECLGDYYDLDYFRKGSSKKVK